MLQCRHEYRQLQDIQRDPLAYLSRAEAGESILVMRDDRPMVELRPVAATRPTPRPFGLASGAFTVPADYDSPLPEDILLDFEGR